MEIKRFLYAYFGFAGIIALISVALQWVCGDFEVLVKHFWVMFFYLLVLTLIAFFVSVLGVRKGGQMGVAAIMGGLLIKLVFALAFFLFLRYQHSGNLITLALNFFCLYLVFTIFEVVGLLRILRRLEK